MLTEGSEDLQARLLRLARIVERPKDARARTSAEIRTLAQKVDKLKAEKRHERNANSG
jgi:hypothetical protein